MSRLPRHLSRWRFAIYTAFFASGLAFASWVTRTPDIRQLLEVTNAQIGWIIFSGSTMSIVGLTVSGIMVSRVGARRTIAVGATSIGLGVALLGLGSELGLIPLVIVGMALVGGGFGTSEVAINVEGATLEAEVGRSIMPALHGSYSVGALAGSGIGALAQLAGIPVGVHLAALGIIAIGGPLAVLRFLPAATGREEPGTHHADGEARASRWSVWREPRTLVLGLIVLGMAFAEGAANDWLPLAIVDGYRVDFALASSCFLVFTGAMAIGRLGGGRFVDRFGRVRVLQVLATTGAAGILLVIFGGMLPLVFLGCVLWGLGVSLGFPLALSAAGDSGRNAAARVSAVATIGYFAFLVGPPSLGLLGESFGLLHAFLLVFVLICAAGLSSPAARESAGSRTTPQEQPTP